MVNRNLLQQYDLAEDQFQQELADADFGLGDDWLPTQGQDFQEQQLITGRVLHVSGDGVWLDVGYKSEGVVELREWFDEDAGQIVPPQPGDQVQLLLEAVEDDSGAVVLSYRKAKRQREWESVIAKHKEGDVVSGLVTRKIKGGLLLNIGVNVFLPASQVDIRRPPDIAEYIGKTIECLILKIDEVRRNIVVSRRRLLEVTRDQMKKTLLAEIEPGQIRKGVVKNIAEFGAFVDLGGIDGLIHNSELSWSRIKHPSEVVQIGDKVMVEVMKFDAEAKKVSLSVKHSLEDPWKTVPEQLVEGTLVPATLIKATQNYLLVELLPGVTGMVPKSEFDAAAPPAQGEQVQVRLLSINIGTRRITASMSKVSGTSSDGAEVQEYLEGQEEPAGNSIGEVVARIEESPAEEPPDTE